MEQEPQSHGGIHHRMEVCSDHKLLKCSLYKLSTMNEKSIPTLSTYGNFQAMTVSESLRGKIILISENSRNRDLFV
jgi:hypothetical protein